MNYLFVYRACWRRASLCLYKWPIRTQYSNVEVYDLKFNIAKSSNRIGTKIRTS